MQQEPKVNLGKSGASGGCDGMRCLGGETEASQKKAKGSTAQMTDREEAATARAGLLGPGEQEVP